MKSSWSDKGIYQIKIKGQLEDNWQDYFDAVNLKAYKQYTIITVKISDQSALHGLFSQIRDFGLSIISVSKIESDSEQIEPTNKD